MENIINIVVTDFGEVEIKKETLEAFESAYLKRAGRGISKKSIQRMHDALYEKAKLIAREAFDRGEYTGMVM